MNMREDIGDKETLTVQDILDLIAELEQCGTVITEIETHPNTPWWLRWAVENWDDFIRIRDEGVECERCLDTGMLDTRYPNDGFYFIHAFNHNWCGELIFCPDCKRGIKMKESSEKAKETVDKYYK
jgi:hypothetical protein